MRNYKHLQSWETAQSAPSKNDALWGDEMSIVACVSESVLIDRAFYWVVDPRSGQEVPARFHKSYETSSGDMHPAYFSTVDGSDLYNVCSTSIRDIALRLTGRYHVHS